jgi:hypothetical protein
MFEWIPGNAVQLLLTLNPGNLTLNAAAARYLDEVRYVSIGLDKAHRRIAIKPVTKREIDLQLVPNEHLHKVTIGNGYARITSKSVCDSICEMAKVKADGSKFKIVYNEVDKMLIVDFSRPSI